MPKILTLRAGALGYYLERVPELGKQLLTSNDVDFCTDKAAMRACAKRLNASLREPLLQNEDSTPSRGLLTWSGPKGDVGIDFLHQDFDDILETSVPVSTKSIQSFRVMNPQRCFEARIHNLSFPGYRGPHAINQLKASVFCLREFTVDVLNESTLTWSNVSNLIERTLRFCYHNENARTAFSKYGVDPFQAVLGEHIKLPEQYVVKRYPQMKAQIASRQY